MRCSMRWSTRTFSKIAPPNTARHRQPEPGKKHSPRRRPGLKAWKAPSEFLAKKRGSSLIETSLRIVRIGLGGGVSAVYNASQWDRLCHVDHRGRGDQFVRNGIGLRLPPLTSPS